MIAAPISDGTALARILARAKRASVSRLAAVYDAQLVHEFKAGSEAAFVEIVVRFRKRIFATALSLVGNRADAEDVAQDTFIRAHRGLANFRGDSSLATWLYRIATNLSRNQYWHSARRHRRTTLSLDFPLGSDSAATIADSIATNEPTPCREAMRGEFSELVTECMDQLQPSYRAILTLRNGLDQSYAEIAAALDIELGTVKSRLARARDNLRRRMIETCPEFAPTDPLSEWFEPNRGGGAFAAVATRQRRGHDAAATPCPR